MSGAPRAPAREAGVGAPRARWTGSRRPPHVEGFWTAGEVLDRIWEALQERAARGAAPGRTSLEAPDGPRLMRPHVGPRPQVARGSPGGAVRQRPSSRPGRHAVVHEQRAGRAAPQLPRLPRVVLRLTPQCSADLAAALQAASAACAGLLEVAVERIDALPDGVAFSLVAWPPAPGSGRAWRRDVAAVATLAAALEAALAAQATQRERERRSRHP